MKKNRITAMFLAFITAFCLMAGIAFAEETGLPVINPGDIVILYTNDVHCAVGQVTDDTGNVVNIGYAGVAALKKYAEQAAGAGNVTLVDAGDFVQGDAVGTMSQGEYITEIMNRIGYDIITLGNHEFDYGMERMYKLMDVSDAQVLSANFIITETDGHVFPPYITVAYGAVTVAYIGITTPEAFTKSNPTYFQDGEGNYIYNLREGGGGADLYNEVQKTIDAAKAAGADYIIAIGHLGVNEESGPWRSIDIIENTTGIDALIDGHSHSVIENQIVKNKDGRDVILTQTGTKLANIGVMTISKDGVITAGLVSGYSEQDADTLDYVNNIMDALDSDLSATVAVSAVDLVINDPVTGERIIRSRETNLGDLVADAYRYVLGTADIGIVNGGGVRADIKAGDISFGDVIAVHPFNNYGCVVEATGAEILDALEMGARNTPAESGGFLNVSGISFTIDTTVESSVEVDDKGNFVGVNGARRVRDVLIGGEPVDENKIYTVASHNYLLLDGGDGFNMFRDNNIVVQPVILDNQVLITYIEEFLGGVVGEEYSDPYGQGRITIKTGSRIADWARRLNKGR